MKNFITSLLFLFPVTLFPQETVLKDFSQEIPGSQYSIEMVGIPEGKFMMGSAADDQIKAEDETPAHFVKIDAFWMSKYELTWDLYYEFLNRAIDQIGKPAGRDVQREVDAVSGATIPYVDMSLGMGTGDDLPVGNVTRLAASKFCEWLSAKTGHFYRLPTEAEWEYAARAGTKTTYYFGDDVSDLSNHSWFYENSNGTYHKVGQKQPNPWGLYDMYGNVAELTLDEYIPTAYKNRNAVTVNPYEIPSEEYPHSVRGGAYYDDAEYLRSAARLGSSESWKMRDPQFPKSKWWNTDAPFVGFRIVRVKNPPETKNYENYWGSQNP